VSVKDVIQRRQHALVGAQVDERDRIVAQLADDRRDQQPSGSHTPASTAARRRPAERNRPVGLKRLLQGDDAAGPGTGGEQDPRGPLWRFWR
jgi:hypothetical protein